MGNLLPWNAFITAASYFESRFCNTDHRDDFENIFAFTTTCAQAISLLFVVKYQRLFSISKLVLYPLGLITTCFVLTTIFVTIRSMSGNELFGTQVFLVLVTGLLTAPANGGCVAVGATFPPAYTNAIYTGQAMAGLIISTLEVITVAANPSELTCSDDDEDDTECSYDSISYAAFSFFLLATLTLVLCIIGFRALMSLKITKHYSIAAMSTASDEKDNFSESAVTSLGENLLHGAETSDVKAQARNAVGTPGLSDAFSLPAAADFSFSVEEIKECFMTIIVPALSVFNVFVVTIGIFPAVTVVIQSTEYCNDKGRFYDDLFTPFLFVMFNIGDFSGRSLASMIEPLFTERTIWIPSLARWIFVPLFCYCNIPGNHLGSTLVNDFWPVFLTLLLGLSNGYVTSLCMMQGPSLVSAEKKSLAGTIMLTMLTFGLLGGATTSFIWTAITVG